ncbi:DUF4157 domain-containing protein [Streptomyces sp. NPDC088923]|uniref:eCIS core domain-containing protein n=1 Tax=Streptomyces sp. NPDC088923 TaxID=3365913 RepID=UPI00382D954A
MRAQEKNGDSARAADRREARSARAAGPLGHLAGAGNAAVVQSLRAAGHPWVQRAAEEDEHRHAPGCGHGPAVQRSAVHDVLRGAGRPLDAGVRTDMEARLGADFSDVRLHDDAPARASAAEVGARAYTSGSHVVLGDGGGDRHTLAHELTHVIQQRTGPVAGTDNGAGLKVSDPSDRFEREAEANAVRALAAGGEHAGAGGHETVQRAEAGQVAGGGPVVQRAYDPDDPENVQNQLYLKHWQERTNPEEMGASPQRVDDGVGYKTEDILDRIGKQLLEELAKKETDAPQLKLYRAVTPAEAEQLRAHWRGGQPARDESYILRGPEGRKPDEKHHSHKGPTLGSHLGDTEQAEDYYQAKKGNDVKLCFTLKPGAHELLFSDAYMAVAPDRKLDVFQQVPELGGKHRLATENEGTREGFIGLKAEEREQQEIPGAKAGRPRKKQSAKYTPQGGDFSISLAGKAKQTSPSRLLFQLFVADVTVEKSKLPRQFPEGESFVHP